MTDLRAALDMVTGAGWPHEYPDGYHKMPGCPGCALVAKLRAALATSDSEEALSGGYTLTITDPSGAVRTVRHLDEEAVALLAAEVTPGEALSGVARDLPDMECLECGGRAAVAVPLDDIDPERLARALHRRINVESQAIAITHPYPGEPDDWERRAAAAIAREYRDAKP